MSTPIFDRLATEHRVNPKQILQHEPWWWRYYPKLEPWQQEWLKTLMGLRAAGVVINYMQEPGEPQNRGCPDA